MTTIFYTATTLDGFLADEQDSLEWLFVQPQDEGGPMNPALVVADVGAPVEPRLPERHRLLEAHRHVGGMVGDALVG